MEENCLICYDKCQPDFNTYLTQNPDLKAEVCNLVCEIYKLSNTDLILDLKNYFNFCQLCFDDLTRVDRTFKSLKRLQESLKKDRNELDNRIRESHKRFRIVPAKNRVINSVRDEIIRKIAAPENVLQTPSESFAFATNEDEPEGIIISNEISQEEDPFGNLDDFCDDSSPILGDVLKEEEEEKELEIPDVKFSIIDDNESTPVPLKSHTNLKQAILILPKIPQIIQEHPMPIRIIDPLVQDFIKQEEQSHDFNTIRPKAIYKCFFCPNIFNNQMTLFRHKKKYHKDDLYPCSELHCKEEFKTLQHLQNHKQNVHAITEITCHFCHEIFNSMEIYREHQREKHAKTLFTCPRPNCNKKYTRKYQLNAHVKDHHTQSTIRKIAAQNQDQIIPNIPQNPEFEILQPEIDSPRPKPQYKCFFCPKIFNNLTSQFLHKKAYHADELYGCSEDSCASQFNTHTELKTHQRNAHSIHEYECCFCMGIYSSQGDLFEHKKQEHGNALFICPEVTCSKEFSKKKILENHIQIKHSSDVAKPKIPCSKEGCGRLFITKSQLNDHLSKHREKAQTYPCAQEGCGLIFQSRSGRRLHLEVHESNRWLCSKCSTSFGHKSALTEHGKECQGQSSSVGPLLQEKRSHLCPTCGKTFHTNHTLKIHLARIHINVTKNAPKIKFKRTRIRKKRQDPPKSYLCEFCSKSFKEKRNFGKHLRAMHASEERTKLQCHLCTKSYYSQRDLDYHINQDHEKKHTHFCDRCGSGFASLGRLNQHQKTHIFTLPCRFCHKRFSSQGQRDSHEVTHSNAMAFQCTQCPKSFKYRIHLKDHEIMKHSPNDFFPYSCEKCGRQFKIKTYLLKHRIRSLKCKVN